MNGEGKLRTKLMNRKSQLRLAQFGRAGQHLQKILNGVNDSINQNSLLDRLHAQILRRPDFLSTTKISFEVLHLNREEGWLNSNLASSQEDVGTDIESLLGTDKYVFVPIYAGGPTISISGLESHLIRFWGEQIQVGPQVSYFAGLGRLSDFVDLYKERGDILFSKNVRSFLRDSKQKSPSKHLKRTLEAICIPKLNGNRLEPGRFALFHNGITLHVVTAERTGDGLAVRLPSILNGCQTVRTSLLFSRDPNRQAVIDQKVWKEIPVPVRVVVTGNEDLVREVTIANNRQTEISASAYRANDPEQLRLQNRLRFEMKIFYERQQCAFDNMRMNNPQELLDDFENSIDAPIRIEPLAQAIACASNLHIEKATRVNDLFDDSEYKKIFCDRNLENLQLLVFLTNLLFTVRLTLKDVKGANGRLAKLPIGRSVYPCTRILARWIIKYKPRFVADYGLKVLGKPAKTRELREELKKLFSFQNTGLQQKLYLLWQNEDGTWASFTDNSRTNEALKQLGIGTVDIFDSIEKAA